MASISSPHNPVVKYVRSLARARVRREEKAYLAEGVRLVSEALATNQRASIVLYDPALLTRSAAGSALLAAIPDWASRSFEVSERVLEAVGQTETPAGVLAVLPEPEDVDLASHSDDPFGLLLDAVADPGNMGAILRTADAAGVNFVCALRGSADLYSPKVVRAGMGAHFRLPLYQDVPWEAIDSMLDRDIVVTDVRGGTSVFDLSWPPRTLLLIGSEARGTSEEGARRATTRVHIPMRSGVESLNASIAAAILIYSALGRNISPA